MDKILPIARLIGRSAWLPPVMIAFILVILAGTIWHGTLQLREGIRRQIINHDGEVLTAAANLEQSGSGSPADLARQLDDASGQLALALRLSKLQEGVIATRIYDARGRFVTALPGLVREDTLSSAALKPLARLEPVSLFQAAARLEDYFLFLPNAEASQRTAPLLSVIIPIHEPNQTNLVAVAELIRDGRSIEREFKALDASLFRQALMAFLASGGIVGMALGWAFRRLQRINRELGEQAERLRRANEELSLAAKTSALGTMTAHVVHGLTSPLMGLQNFVSTHAGDTDEWREAVQSTQRMQTLVAEIIRLLGEQAEGITYEVSLAELLQVIEAKIGPAAQAARVHFTTRLTGAGKMTNHHFNLVLLILENLVQNAIQVTPVGKSVALTLAPSPKGMICEVQDEGPGLPREMVSRLFVPCRSTKPGGNGIGLAISRQLAHHLGGELKLVRTAESGCVFALDLPSTLFVQSDPTHPLNLSASGIS